MPEMNSKRAPISRAPTAFEIGKWRDLLALRQRVNDKMFSLDLRVECLIIRAQFCAENGIPFPFPPPIDLEQRYLKLKKWNADTSAAIDGAQAREYGCYWRNGDFDILDPSQSLGALFIPIAIGLVIIAGCFATLWEIEKGHEEIEREYKKLNSATENFLCKDPNSDTCKKWTVVKAEQKIEEKETFGERLSAGLSKGLSIGVAVVIGLIAFSIWRK